LWGVSYRLCALHAIASLLKDFTRIKKLVARDPRHVLSRFGKLEGREMAAKKRKRRDWTKGDVREFKALARKKTPAAKIAKLFRRTEGAIRQKAIRMGMSLNSRGGKS
jgi:hypothetical protein